MLTLQRASAGSGKTYTLAQIFIQNLIAYKTEEGKWRLRNERQIEDALQHILAITFTNKATNEMKQRIVNNLALLSKADGMTVPSKDFIDDIPYLQLFHETIGASYSDIGKASKIALRTILNNYSYFKISTIDSFFQEILRTFVYEANLNDSYQLEINSDFVTEAALDAALYELDTHPENMGNAIFWLNTLMKGMARTQRGWNIFSKSGNSDSLYHIIKKTLGNLEDENYKKIKDELDTFFADPDSRHQLKQAYLDLIEAERNEVKELLDDIKSQIDVIDATIETNGIIRDKHINNNVLKHFEKFRALVGEMDYEGKKIKDFKYGDYLEGKSIFKAAVKKIDTTALDLEAQKFYRLIHRWFNPEKDSYRIARRIYGELMPYMGLILEIKNFISKILESNNLIQISETSFILKKIIGEDDAPFVYERLGNRIDNYLIDEFQDTSQMQWDIISPLLTEGLAKGKDSLIIGDPKQSIYRFRNANHKLITRTVPATFPLHEAKGESVADNTNWRSHTNIVKFNNYFFRNLAHEIGLLSKEIGADPDFSGLYFNVVQYPSNQNGLGYVEVMFLSEETDEMYPQNLWLSEEDIENIDLDDDGSFPSDKWTFETSALNHLAPLVAELLKRGYRGKDIGILVSKNSQGKSIVESFLAYNETRKDDELKINFISEESLLVSSSPVVSIIINVFEKLTHPQPVESSGSINNGNESKGKAPVKWRDIKVNYELYSLKHPEMTPTERIISFLDSPDNQNSLENLLSDSSIPTLTSIVENIIKNFTDDEMREAEALFISSFQDLVNEYSSGHPNDIASFLEWWYSRGSKASVSCPSFVDAVQIMTIHKSKGLEFKCVIVPFAKESFKANAKKEEWRWVKPLQLEDVALPPYIPVKTSRSLVDSPHADIYLEFFNQYATDILNTYYVAFTRAKNELYIFANRKASSQNMSGYLDAVLTNPDILGNRFKEEELDNILNPSSLISDENLDKIMFGSPFTSRQIEDENKKDLEKEKNDGIETHMMEGYFVNESRPKLRSFAARVLPSGDLEK